MEEKIDVDHYRDFKGESLFLIFKKEKALSG